MRSGWLSGLAAWNPSVGFATFSTIAFPISTLNFRSLFVRLADAKALQRIHGGSSVFLGKCAAVLGPCETFTASPNDGPGLRENAANFAFHPHQNRSPNGSKNWNSKIRISKHFEPTTK